MSRRTASPLFSLLILVCAVVCAGLGERSVAAQQTRAGRKAQGSVRLTSRAVYSREEFRRIVDQTVHEEAARYRIDPLLVYALIQQESGSNPNALSPKGALGVMQLMPGTAARFGVRDRRDPRESIRAGVKYLVWLMDRFKGNVRLGLAGYNAGEGAVDKYGQRIPPYRETQEYVRRIEAIYLRMARMRKGGVPIHTAPQRIQPASEVAESSTPSYSFRFRVPHPEAAPTTAAVVDPNSSTSPKQQ